MEANDHFNFTGLPPAPAASGLKPSPSSGEGLYTNGSPMNFSQQGKSLNGDVNVNGLSTVSHTTSGILNSAPHSSGTSHLHHPNVAYDCLWNYPQYPPASTGSNLKDPPLLSQFSGHRQYPLNGTVGGSRQDSPPSQNTNLRAGNQEFWANGTQSPMGLNFDSQELYDSFPDQNFEVMSNGPPSFFTSSPPSPMLGSSVQTFAPSQESEHGGHPGEAADKELTPIVAENGTGLVGSLELEGEQSELKICGYNSSASSVESLHQEVSVLVPAPTVSCLDDSLQLPEQLEDSSILDEDPLEPFDSLAAEPGSGELYGLDDSELVGKEDKLPLGDSPDISALDCPSLNNSTAFSLLADDSQTSASIFANPTSPPVLGESVLQDGSFELNNSSDPEQEEVEMSELNNGSDPEQEVDMSELHDGSDLEQEELEMSELNDGSDLEPEELEMSGLNDGSDLELEGETSRPNNGSDPEQEELEMSELNNGSDPEQEELEMSELNNGSDPEQEELEMSEPNNGSDPEQEELEMSEPNNGSDPEQEELEMSELNNGSDPEQEEGETSGPNNGSYPEQEEGETSGPNNGSYPEQEEGETSGPNNGSDPEQEELEMSELRNGYDPEEEEVETSGIAGFPGLSQSAPAGLSPEDTDTDRSSGPACTSDLGDKTGGETGACGNGDVLRRRIATPEEVRFPLQHGWRREVRIKKGSHRWQGETWYYGPCGKRMKQFPEVIKYLSRNVVHHVRREHFSFSPRMAVGDFYEERDTPEGLKWVQLSVEEIPSRIQAITGKRGRPRNTEKAKAEEMPKVKRGRGRPPKVKITELLSKTDSRPLKRLEVPDTPNDGDKAKMSKMKKKIRRKAKNQRKQEAKSSKQKEIKKKSKAEKEKVKAKADKLKVRKEKVKPKEEARPACKTDRVSAPQRRLEERQRQQMILEEMKKPTEDMCLVDHQPLPAFSRIPGLVLPGSAFSHCLTIVEFLHSFGKVLGLDPAKDVPSLGALQEGLLCQGEALGEVQDLLMRLLRAALCDPGLPAYCQSLKILGEKVSEIPLTRDNVSEILRCFLMAYGAEPAVCDSLRTKPFQAQTPQHKAAVLAFLVHELNGSNLIINEIDKTLENMSNYRRNKWIVEGRLRRLKMALAKRTGRSEAELLGSEESLGRRRSSRIPEETSGMEEEEEEEAAAALAAQGRRGRRDEEGDGLAFSIPELERQIEKLIKRQLFFRKKLLHSSQMLRAVSLGQDRYRRRYWVLPYLSGIFVEGAEEATALEDVIKQEATSPKGVTVPAPSTPPFSAVKKELVEGNVRTWSPCARARGRPRKTKLVPEQPDIPVSPVAKKEPELAQEQAQVQVEAQEQALNGLLEPEDSPMSLGQSQHDLSQSAFLSWLSQTQSHRSLLSSSVLTPDSSPGKLEPGPPMYPEEPEPSQPDPPNLRGPWFNLLPRTPCDAAPSTSPCASEDGPTPHPPTPPASSQPVNGSSAAKPCSPKPLSSTPLSVSAPKRWADVPGKGSQITAGLEQPKRRGRPPSKFFKQMEQRYLTQLTAQPVPTEMCTGWWWIGDPEELEATLRALHPRGIREKALHKHLSKHRDFLREVCLRPPTDPILRPSRLPTVSQKELVCWSPAERTFEADLATLRCVEELEQRVLLADLQIRGWTCPSPDSAREDLAYCEHLPDPLEDITARGRGRDGQALQREDTNPLDLAVLRLAALEQNVERRYLREPLWPPHEVVLEKALLSPPDSTALGTTEIAYEITPRIRTWRQTLERCRSAAQVCLCLGQLERSIAWEKSVNKVTCLVCRKGDNDEFLLLCDGCDRGCHIYCHRPKMDTVPEGDWFCAVCMAQQAEGAFPRKPGFPKRGQKRKGGPLSFSEPESRRQRRRPRAVSQHQDGTTVSRYSGEGLSSSRRRRLSMRHHHSDLTFCEIILMEMESHDSAWPFLEPVNPRLVSGYRRIIKNPMDFSTMRERLLQGGYSNSEEFAADALLVFDNCQTFNEDDSEVGKAGHIMRRFFESRWEEFYQGKQANL